MAPGAPVACSHCPRPSVSALMICWKNAFGRHHGRDYLPLQQLGGHRGVWRVLGHQVRDWCLPGPTLHTPGLFPVEHAPWADVAWSDGATPNGPRALGCLGV